MTAKAKHSPLSRPTALAAETLQQLRQVCSEGQPVAWLRVMDNLTLGSEGQASLSWPQPSLVWLGWQDDAALLVIGEGEQQVPGLLEAARKDQPVLITVRASDTKARVLTWPTQAQVLEPQSEQWKQAAHILAPLRLNGPVAAPALPSMWEQNASIVRLQPWPAQSMSPHIKAFIEHPGLAGVASNLPSEALSAALPIPLPLRASNPTLKPEPTAPSA